MEAAHISFIRETELIPGSDIPQREQCQEGFLDIGFVDVTRVDFAVWVAGVVL
jgi:hypothetical protein